MDQSPVAVLRLADYTTAPRLNSNLNLTSGVQDR
jgi:hypothetical protein